MAKEHFYFRISDYDASTFAAKCQQTLQHNEHTSLILVKEFNLLPPEYIEKMICLFTLLAADKKITSLKIARHLLSDSLHDSLGHLLRNNYTIKYLNLRCSLTPQLSFALATSLKENTTIISLNVAGCDLHSEGAKALASSLHYNHTLQYLHLGHSQIGPSEMKALGEALIVNKGLSCLNVSGNIFDKEAAVAFSKGLMQNRTLRSLCISYTCTQTNMLIPILRALLINSTLLEIECFHHRPLSKKLAATIQRVIIENSTLTRLGIEFTQYPLPLLSPLSKAYQKRSNQLHLVRINQSLNISENASTEYSKMKSYEQRNIKNAHALAELLCLLRYTQSNTPVLSWNKNSYSFFPFSLDSALYKMLKGRIATVATTIANYFFIEKANSIENHKFFPRYMGN